MNNSFITGFEKISKLNNKTSTDINSEESGFNFKPLLTIPAQKALSLSSYILAHKASELDRGSLKDANRIIKSMIASDSKTKTILDLSGKTIGQFNLAKNTVTSSPHLGILAHELGHASMKDGGAINKLRQFFTKHKNSLKHPALAGMVLSASDNKNLSDFATNVAIAATLPKLIEEGIATTKGLHAVYKNNGFARSLKSSVPLSLGFLSHSTIPLTALAFNKLFRKKNENSSTERRSKTKTTPASAYR